MATSTSFINFGAFTALTAFTLVNLSVLGYCLRQYHDGRRFNPLAYVVLPLLGAGVDLYLLTELDSAALLLGVSWLTAGAVYLLADPRHAHAADRDAARRTPT